MREGGGPIELGFGISSPSCKDNNICELHFGLECLGEGSDPKSASQAKSPTPGSAMCACLEACRCVAASQRQSPNLPRKRCFLQVL